LDVFGWSLLGFEGYPENGILQWYQSIDLAQPVEVAIYDTGGKPYICYRGRRYRDTGRRLENTYGEGDCVRVVDTEQEEPVVNVEQEEPMVDTEQEDPMADDGQKKFANMLLKLVQNLSRQIEVMGQRFTTVEARQCESPRVFQIGEGLGASHHLPEQGATQRDTTQQVASHAPIRSTMPTFLGVDMGGRSTAGGRAPSYG